MKKVAPIKPLDIIKIYNRLIKWGNHREAELVLFGCNVSLSISDILQLKFDDIHIIDVHNEMRGCLELKNKRTDKTYNLLLNNEAMAAIDRLRQFNQGAKYLFEATGNRTKYVRKPISRQWVSVRLKDVEESLGLNYSLNTSSLRKTFFLNTYRHETTAEILRKEFNIDSD